MELIPHDELKPGHNFNFAPMIDFLFLMLALFATLAVSRAALYDSEINLVQLKPDKSATSLRAKDIHCVNLSISETGSYKWLTEFQEYPMGSIQAVQEELARQYQIGVLPQDKEKTEVLLHIDRKAPWESIAQILYAVHQMGFKARPIHSELSQKVPS